jgi:outer membrane usher protein FimD/PapC
LISYRLDGTLSGRPSNFAVDVQYRSRFLSPMEEPGSDTVRYSLDVAARYQAELVEGWFLNATAGYSKARGNDQDLKSASVGVSHRFGKVNATLGYSYVDPAPRSNHRVGLTLSLPIGRRQQLRGGLDSDRNRIFADYNLQGFEGLNQLNGRLSLSRTNEGESAVIGGEYYGNRFRATANHSYDRSNGVTRAVTDLGLTVGVGFADGHFAIGRDADRGFTIVSKHATLRDATATVSDSSAVGATARTGTLGAALVPTRRGYQPSSIKVEVDPLPAGYDIGAGQIDILPGAASGYVMKVGSAASNIVIGRLVNQKGEPVAFVSGRLVPIGRPNETGATFITNRNGRLVAQKVAPGRYEVIPAGGLKIAEISVPDEATGMVDIGILTKED